jgi:hypothetical protein
MTIYDNKNILIWGELNSNKLFHIVDEKPGTNLF